MTLDIDKSIINEKLRVIKDELEENVMPWLPRNASQQFAKPSKSIKPFPGACIKMWTENGDKVYINLCHSKEIYPPEDISDEKFYQLLQEEIPGFVIPIATGLEKMVKDKDNIDRSCFDVLINTTFFEKCMKKQHFLAFTIATIREYIKDKYKISINASKYVVLKNKKVQGSLGNFTIEDRPPRKPEIKKPLIQELDSKDNSNLKQKPITAGIKSNNQYSCNQQNMKYQNYIIINPHNNKNLLAFFYLPSSSTADIIVDIAENRIMVENIKTNYITDVLIPNHIDTDNVTANYDSKLHILRLMLPLIKLDQP